MARLLTNVFMVKHSLVTNAYEAIQMAKALPTHQSRPSLVSVPNKLEGKTLTSKTGPLSPLIKRGLGGTYVL